MTNRFLFNRILAALLIGAWIQGLPAAFASASKESSAAEDLVRRWLELYERGRTLSDSILEFQRESSKRFLNFEVWHEAEQECPDYKAHKRMLDRQARIRRSLAESTSELIRENERLAKQAADFRNRLQAGDIAHPDLFKVLTGFTALQTIEAELDQKWHIMRVGQIQILLDHRTYSPSPDIY